METRLPQTVGLGKGDALVQTALGMVHIFSFASNIHPATRYRLYAWAAPTLSEFSIIVPWREDVFQKSEIAIPVTDFDLWKAIEALDVASYPINQVIGHCARLFGFHSS